MKKNENVELFLEIIHQKLAKQANELKGGFLYLSTESISVVKLAEIIGKSASEIIAFFWQKGEVISKNQWLSWELLSDYCKSAGIKIKKKDGLDFGEVIRDYLEKLGSDEQLIERPPVVSIMGHIDHGKTTLLDTIRQTNIQQKEVGGITQKITVSQVDFHGKKITFLDTPGHNDFIKMRRRGISLTDIVVLVIDGGDGVMSQTTEIINYLQQYQIPTIIFINHKRPSETNNEVNLNRIRTQLQEKGLTPLEWGGEAILVSGNAREEESANYLLENISLLADFKTNLSQPANGVVIDSYLQNRTGSRLAELLVQGGKIEEKDNIFLNGRFGKIKMLYDLYGKKITAAFPGEVVQVVGLTFSVELGEKFLVLNDEKFKESLEKQLVNYLEKRDKLTTPKIVEEKRNINLFLLTDSQNTLEALKELVKKKSSVGCTFSVVYTAIGSLNDSAIDLAKITQSIILVLGMSLDKSQQKTLKGDNIHFFSSKIIYEIDDKLTEFIDNNQEVEEIEEIVGKARVEKSFYFSKVGNIAGCQVTSGKISRNNRVHILRDKGKEKVFTGSIKSLESNKEKKTEVVSGYECGIVLNGFDDFREGDEIIAFRMIKKDVGQT